MTDIVSYLTTNILAQPLPNSAFDTILDQVAADQPDLLMSREQVQAEIKDLSCRNCYFVYKGEVNLEYQLFNHPIRVAKLTMGDAVLGTSYYNVLLKKPPIDETMGFDGDGLGSTEFSLNPINDDPIQFIRYCPFERELIVNAHDKYQISVQGIFSELLKIDFSFKHFYLCSKSLQRNVKNFLSIRNLDIEKFKISMDDFFVNTSRYLPDLPKDVDLIHMMNFKNYLIETHTDFMNNEIARNVFGNVFLVMLQLSSKCSTTTVEDNDSKTIVKDKYLSPHLKELDISSQPCSALTSPTREHVAQEMPVVTDVTDYLCFDDNVYGIESAENTDDEDIKVKGVDMNLLNQRFDELGIAVATSVQKSNDTSRISSKQPSRSVSADDLFKLGHFHELERDISQSVLDLTSTEVSYEEHDSDFNLASSSFDTDDGTSGPENDGINYPPEDGHMSFLVASCVDLSSFDLSIVDDESCFFLIVKEILSDMKVLDFQHLQILQESCIDSGPFLTNKFDVTAFSRRPITSYYLVLVLFQFLGIIKLFSLNESSLRDFCYSIFETMSQNNAYHGRSHILDVLYVITYWLADPKTIGYITPEETLALAIAAFCHDAGHPGLNEACLRKIKHPIVMAFPNQSPLEQLHWRITKHSTISSGLIAHLGTETIINIMDMVEKLILATDMSRHSKILQEAEQLQGFTLEELPQQKRLLFLQLIIKAADIANVSRPFKLAKRWAQRYYREVQEMIGEHKVFIPLLNPPLPQSLVDICRQQLGFIGFLAAPLFEILSQCYPPIAAAVDVINSNVFKYKSIIEKREGGSKNLY
ncbi:hypothetical protein PCE1_001964 [Barthelona sp. PCE]